MYFELGEKVSLKLFSQLSGDFKVKGTESWVLCVCVWGGQNVCLFFSCSFSYFIPFR